MPSIGGGLKQQGDVVLEISESPRDSDLIPDTRLYLGDGRREPVRMGSDGVNVLRKDTQAAIEPGHVGM